MILDLVMILNRTPKVQCMKEIGDMPDFNKDKNFCCATWSGE